MSEAGERFLQRAAGLGLWRPRTNPPGGGLVHEPQGRGCGNQNSHCPAAKLTQAPLPSRCPEPLPKRETVTEDGSAMGKGTQSPNCPSSLLGREAHEKYGSPNSPLNETLKPADGGAGKFVEATGGQWISKKRRWVRSHIPHLGKEAVEDEGLCSQLHQDSAHRTGLKLQEGRRLVGKTFLIGF